MQDKKYSKNIASSIFERHYITTTQQANKEKKITYQLDLFDSILNENEQLNNTGFDINKAERTLIEKGETIIKFNDLEVLKQFKSQKTIDNIQHFNRLLIDMIYRKHYLVSKNSFNADIPVMKFENNFFKSFVSKNITDIREFLDKYRKYNKECVFYSYRKTKDKTEVSAKDTPKYFIEQKIEKEKGKRKREVWSFEVNKQYNWKDYLKQYIDIPKYLLDYTGIKERIIDNIFKQLRIQKQSVITLKILDLIEYTGILEKQSNLNNKKNRIIKPVEKALKEIAEDKKQTYLKIDLSKVNNINLTKFLNSKIDITVIYNNYFLTQNTEKEESKENTENSEKEEQNN